MKKFFKKILCPIDLQDDTVFALDVAHSLAEGADATICILSVLPVVLSSAPGVNPLPIPESEAQVQLHKIARQHLPGNVHYEVYTKIGGEPANAILSTIETLGIDSVVMSTHGRKGIGRLILGSVAERVVREAPCPVLTVRKMPGK
jgi:nucleotide-binding universal stress UspA family protein